jgi:hypothetical protein
MTGRGRALGVVAGAILMTCLVLPLTAPQASACNVSYGYPPSLNINKPNLGITKPCSSGTSLAGAVIVAILTIGALAAAGGIAFKRGAATAGPSSPDQALTTYLHATGMASHTPPGEGDRDAHRNP